MTTAADVLGVTAGAYSGLVGLFGPPSRSVAGLVADAVLEEAHTDELTLTDHPIEYGSVITDHAFKQPSEVVITYGWSQSPNSLSAARDVAFSKVGEIQAATSPTGVLQAISGTARINNYYAILLDKQNTRAVFDVVTGRRTYKNMMIRSLTLVTDRDTENALIIRITCRQVVFADTVTTIIASPAVQSDPQQTGADAPGGVKNLVPGPDTETLGVIGS